MTSDENSDRIGFIGCGAMAQALATGLVGSGVRGQRLSGSDPSPEQREAFRAATGATVHKDNSTLVAESHVVVLAVKPALVTRILSELPSECEPGRPLFISIAAGITLETLGASLPEGTRIVRAMPNTPALVSEGATAFCGNTLATSDDLATAETLFNAVGLTWVAPSESHLDAATGLSGSGPAYVFLILEALTEAGIEQGIPPEAARRLATQTLLGAATLAHQSEEPPQVLRERVSSPGGTTIAGLAELDAGDLRGLISRAVAAATARSRELSQNS